ncbi:hypothetical protein RSAG8_09611, partial [Rhizoctonia solani AG-8 WAC10335]
MQHTLAFNISSQFCPFRPSFNNENHGITFPDRANAAEVKHQARINSVFYSKILYHYAESFATEPNPVALSWNIFERHPLVDIDITKDVDEEGLECYRLNPDIAFHLCESLFQVCVVIINYCNNPEHMANYDRFSPVYERFRLASIMYPQEVNGMFDDEYWLQGFPPSNACNYSVARAQIWAIGMCTALYCLAMYDGISYDEMFGDTTWLPDMNNRNTPDASAPNSPLLWADTRLPGSPTCTTTTLPQYTPPPLPPPQTPPPAWQATIEPCKALLPHLFPHLLSTEERCKYLGIATALPATKEIICQSILGPDYHIYGHSIFEGSSDFYEFVVKKEAEMFLKKLDPAKYGNCGDEIVKPANWDHQVEIFFSQQVEEEDHSSQSSDSGMSLDSVSSETHSSGQTQDAILGDEGRNTWEDT